MSKTKKILTWGGGAFVALVVIGALASPTEEDVTTEAETTTTTVAPAETTEAPTTTVAEPTTEVTIDNDTFFELIMSMQDPEQLESICPTYAQLPRSGRELMVANSFTPTQDLDDYPGWTGTDMTLAATNWFDGACGV